MTITTIYLVSVKVPEEVHGWRQCNVTDSAWDHEVTFARLHNLCAGEHEYGQVIWAEFHEREKAVRCEQFLNSLIEKYRAKMAQEGEQP